MKERDRDKLLIKSLYKYMLKNYQSVKKNKKVTKEIVDDILDPNHKAQVDPDKIPVSGKNVIYKANVKQIKGNDYIPKGAKAKGVKTLKDYVNRNKNSKNYNKYKK